MRTCGTAHPALTPGNLFRQKSARARAVPKGMRLPALQVSLAGGITRKVQKVKCPTLARTNAARMGHPKPSQRRGHPSTSLPGIDLYAWFPAHVGQLTGFISVASVLFRARCRSFIAGNRISVSAQTRMRQLLVISASG